MDGEAIFFTGRGGEGQGQKSMGKVEIRAFILPRNFPAVLIIFTGRGGAGNPPFPTVRGGAGKGSKSAGLGGAGAGNILRVLIEFVC